jgi:hypothetical protein
MTRKTIIKYVPNGGQAGCKSKVFPRAREGGSVTVDWTNPAVIHISIGVVSSIAEKLDEVDGVHISYDIGTLISEACKDRDARDTSPARGQSTQAG